MGAGMSTVTDHKWKQLKYRYEVPKGILDDELDWTTEDDIDGYLCYRGWWYHLGQFEHRNSMEGWDGVHCDSFFSGVVIKLNDDGETYMIGTVYS